MNRSVFCAALVVALVALSSLAPAAVVNITTTTGTSQDGMIYSNPGVPFPLSTFYPIIALGATGGPHDTVSLVQFDLSSVKATPGQVSKAELTLFTASSKAVNGTNLDPDALHPLTVDVSPITSTWNRNTVTWGTAPTHGSVATSFVTDGIGEFVTVDITSIVQGWLTNPASNRGLWLSGHSIQGSGPSNDASPFYAVAFNAGYVPGVGQNPPTFNVNPPTLAVTVPEPSTVVLGLLAVPCLAWACRRQLRRRASRS